MLYIYDIFYIIYAIFLANLSAAMLIAGRFGGGVLGCRWGGVGWGVSLKTKIGQLGPPGPLLIKVGIVGVSIS